MNEYVNDFVTTIQEGDVRAIHRMIPGLRHCEEFEIQDYNADSIVIQKQADGYHVRFSDHCSVVVLRDKSGKLSIGKTYGLAVFDADLYDFALRTGWISRDMDDAAILLQLVKKLSSTNVSPMEFYLEDFTCDACKRHEDRIMIPDVGDSLIFQLSRRLSSTEINLIEMQSN